MKRGISFLLAWLMMAMTTVTLFAGCKSEDSKMLVSEWLFLINDSFGFEGYSETEPYIEGITAGTAGYDDVQTAFEYSVLPEGYTALDLDAELTREFCALTLAGAIYTPKTDAIDIADSSKLMFPDSVLTVVNYGVMELDSKNRFNPADNVPYDEAVGYIAKARDAWVNQKFENVADFEIQESVVDLSGMSTYKINEDGTSYIDSGYQEEQMKWLSDNNYSYDSSTGIVKLDNIDEKGIEVGSILTLPATLENPGGLMLKVSEISADGNTYTMSTEEPDIIEVLGENATISGTTTLDFSKAIVYDADGNLISAGIFGENGNTATPMSYSNMGRTTEGEDSVNFKINISDKVTASVKMDKSKIEVVYEGKVSDSDTLELGAELSDIKTVRNFETGTLFAPYKDMSLKFGIEYDTTYKAKYKKEIYKKEGEKFSIEEAEILDEAALKKILAAVDDSGGWNNVKNLASICIPVDGVNYVKLAVIGKIGIDGSAEISLAFADGGIGIEKRKNSRCLPVTYYDTGVLQNVAVKGEIEADISAGVNVAWAILGQSIADFEGGIGLKAALSATLNAVTNERFLKASVSASVPGSVEYAISNTVILANNVASIPNIEYLGCLELDVTPYVYVTALTGQSAVGKLVKVFNPGFELKVEHKFPSLFNAHAEIDKTGFHFTDCTIQERIEDGIERGDSIGVSPTDISINPGETKECNFTMLPEDEFKYYSLEDIVVESADEKIALAHGEFDIVTRESDKSVFSSIVALIKGDSKYADSDTKTPKISITGVATGDTIVTVRTRDNRYSREIRVHVNDGEELNLSSLRLETFAKSLSVGETGSIGIQEVPFGKSELNVFWECDNTSVATVNSVTGDITAVGEGTATVSAYISGMEETSKISCLITVSDYGATGVVDGIGAPAQWIKVEGLHVMIIEEA